MEIKCLTNDIGISFNTVNASIWSNIKSLNCSQNKSSQMFTVVLFLSKNIKELEFKIEKLSIIFGGEKK